MEQTTPKQNVPLKKGLIASLLVGVAMIYFSDIFGFLRYISSFSDTISFAWHRIVEFLPQIIAAVIAVLFINKNKIISLVAFILYGILALCSRFLLFSDVHWERIAVAVLAGLTLYGLNKANKTLAIISSALLTVIVGYQLIAHSRYFGSLYGSSALEIYSAVFLWCSHYGQLLLPVLLLICSIKPACIHNSIKIADGYLGVQIVLFVAGVLLGGNRFNIFELIDLCWMPVMMVLGLNAVLFFPIPFVELAKIFGKSLFAVVVIAIIVVAAGSAQDSINEAEEKAEQQREQYLNQMKDNMLTWQEAGFSDTFTVEAAQSMLTEGRITYSEYQWLVQQLLSNG